MCCCLTKIDFQMCRTGLDICWVPILSKLVSVCCHGSTTSFIIYIYHAPEPCLNVAFAHSTCEPFPKGKWKQKNVANPLPSFSSIFLSNTCLVAYDVVGRWTAAGFEIFCGQKTCSKISACDAICKKRSSKCNGCNEEECHGHKTKQKVGKTA